MLRLARSRSIFLILFAGGGSDAASGYEYCSDLFVFEAEDGEGREQLRSRVHERGAQADAHRQVVYHEPQPDHAARPAALARS